jgi:rhodanese-related sulfurtransferase
MSPEVDITAFAEAHAVGAPVIDVREPFEYVSGHVPRARLLPMTQVHDGLRDLPRDRPVYVICASGNRSLTAVSWLRNAGVEAYSVAGGIGHWIRRGFPVVRGVNADGADF